MWKISLQYIQQSNIKIVPLWRSQYLPYIYPGLLFSDWFLEWLKVLRSNPIRKTMEDLFLCHLNLQKEGTTVLFKYRKHLPSFDIFDLTWLYLINSVNNSYDDFLCFYLPHTFRPPGNIDSASGMGNPQGFFFSCLHQRIRAMGELSTSERMGNQDLDATLKNVEIPSKALPNRSGWSMSTPSPLHTPQQSDLWRGQPLLLHFFCLLTWKLR